MSSLTDKTKHIKIIRKMKKIEYMAPEMEVVEMKRINVLLQASGENAGGSGSYDPSQGDPNE